METFEATELIPVGDEQHRRLVSVTEILDELRSTKKRLLDLEKKFEQRAYHSEISRSRAARFAAHSHELEARADTDGEEPDASDCLGDGEHVASVLADMAPEDSFAVRSPHVEVELAHALNSAVSEHQLCDSIAGD
jgi:hypothetical protein